VTRGRFRRRLMECRIPAVFRVRVLTFLSLVKSGTESGNLGVPREEKERGHDVSCPYKGARKSGTDPSRVLRTPGLRLGVLILPSVRGWRPPYMTAK
jgi:hypothetical protein